MITTEQLVQIKRDLLDAAKLVSRRAMTVGRHAGIDGSSHSVERRIRGAFEDAYEEFEETLEQAFMNIRIGLTTAEGDFRLLQRNALDVLKEKNEEIDTLKSRLSNQAETIRVYQRRHGKAVLALQGNGE